MDNFDPAQQMADAVEILSMLEYLTETLGRESNVRAPWAGITLTIKQAREKITLAHNTLAGGFVDSPQPPSRLSEPVRSSALADRIQQIPLGGSRARDLVAGAGAVTAPKSTRPATNNAAATTSTDTQEGETAR